MTPDLRLFQLLPALHRLRDTEQGLADLEPAVREALLASGVSLDDKVYGPLKSLLAIIADQMAVLEENLDQLYDDQFIETCAEWVVPYIGQLVGSRDLIPIPDAPVSQRSEVANTISYRRRKGTAAIVEQLARDITGWNANVVEYFQHLCTTQYMNHLRPQNLSLTPLRNWEPLEYAGTPFDRSAKTADVRNIAKGRGKYNIPNIGIFLWRLNSYSVGRTPAFQVDARRYLFDPIGAERPLYNHPVPEKEITHLAEPHNVPMPIGRKILDRYLESFYGPDKSLLLFVDGLPVIDLNDETLPPASPPIPGLRDLICVCDLSDITDGMGNVIGWGHMPDDKIAIDPVLGRIAFPALQPPPDQVETIHYYAFSAEMGGGGYEREQTFTSEYDVLVKVPTDAATIQDALNQVQTDLTTSGKTIGVVEIEDSGVYYEELQISPAMGQTIELRAADKSRPVVVTTVGIEVEADEKTVVILNGLLVQGGGIVNDASSKLAMLRLVHCTLVPESILSGSPPVTTSKTVVQVLSAETMVEIVRSITGAMQIHEDATMSIIDSMVDAGSNVWPAYTGVDEMEPGAPMHAQNTTFIGKVHTRILSLASNCIFYAALSPGDAWTAAVLVQRLQQGCARYSWFPVGSRIPRAFRCLPASLADAVRVSPMFQSLRYGDPAYGQLSRFGATEIAQGADDGSEMGAFHHLYTPQRIANLRIRLDEYMRFGLEAGIFFAS